MGAIERAQTRGVCEGMGRSDPHLPPLFALSPRVSRFKRVKIRSLCPVPARQVIILIA